MPVQPCPFCGGPTGGQIGIESPMITEWQIVCMVCRAQGPAGKTQKEAAEKWNYRETRAMKVTFPYLKGNLVEGAEAEIAKQANAAKPVEAPAPLPTQQEFL